MPNAAAVLVEAAGEDVDEVVAEDGVEVDRTTNDPMIGIVRITQAMALRTILVCPSTEGARWRSVCRS